MKRNFLITVDGQAFNVTVVEKDSTDSAVGEVTPLPVIEKSNGSANPVEKAGQGKPIIAPMAGKIFTLLVQEGEMVERGQPLLVLEAMKLENDIVASQDGKVERVLVKVGQSVETGDELILISNI